MKPVMKKYLKLLVIFLVFLLFVCYLYYNPIIEFPKYPKEYPVDAVNFDENLTKLYTTTIKPTGAERLNSICCSVREINNSEDKLNSIAEWTIQDFFYGDNKNVICADRLCRYWIYENGNIRAYSSEERFLFWEYHWNSPFRDDPYWISYYKVGACEELAVLFNEIASRTGFTTRRVGHPNIHEWVEIKMNDTWWYFDPTYYYQSAGNRNISYKWFNLTSNYRKNCWDFHSKVIVTETGEDISDNY